MKERSLQPKVRSWFAVCAALAALPLFADLWTDPDTGYTWRYNVVGDTVEIGGGDGYWFKGWAKSRTAGTAYQNGQTVKDLVPGGQVLHIYGAWGQKAK